ncbi:MAG TPA: hypothetical protein DDW50_21655 [Firmicutes bacterium]|nr:hypothetical protein [Bacillota bacterium]
MFKGKIVGKVGSIGFSTGPDLYFKVHKAGTPQIR